MPVVLVESPQEAGNSEVIIGVLQSENLEYEYSAAKKKKVLPCKAA